ncbi:MAG TPA: hemolysin family protein [Gemmatimonadales bacterium]|nr:hemolysin family protein [Gemmatimonadales bacterium]
MIAMLQLFIAPLLAALLTLWAAWLALAAESDADLPRALSGQLGTSGSASISRHLHIAHLALLMLAGAAAGGAVAWWAWTPALGLLRLFLAVLLVWVLGDLVPRLLAAVAPELTVPVRRGAVATLVPFRPLLRLAAWADERAQARAPTRMSRESGEAQRDMLLGVFSLADTTVAEVMTPRLDIVAVDTSADREEVVNTLRSSEHARLLVYDGHPDAVVGVIYAKDILAIGPDDPRPWHALIRPAAFVPEGKTLDRQVRDFQRGPSHLAVVVDEFGGTAGIVTLEDILEEIVGEIQDEYDTDEVAPIQVVRENHWRVEGGVALAELEQALGHDFGRDDVSTVGGLVLAEFGRVPRSGESINVQGYRLVVEHVVRRRIKRVAVHRLPGVVSAGASEREAR